MGFNSDEYAWKDITVVIGGRVVTGIRKITYDIERKVTHIYGKGSDPHSRTKGNKKYVGGIELLQSEIIAIEKSAGPGKDATDITFDIICAYASEEGGAITTDLLQNCDITKYNKGGKQDDEIMPSDATIMIGKIIPGI